jgi:GTP-binding protein
MDPTAGVTRDLIRVETEWDGTKVTLVDSGGLFNEDADELNKLVHERSKSLLDEADVVVFLCDINAILPSDKDISRLIHKAGKKAFCIPAGNKADRLGKYDYPSECAEFRSLGFGEPVLVSASHGLGIGELTERIVKLIRERGEEFIRPENASKEEEESAIAVCIAGKPNAGKSTLLNRLAGKELSIVHDRPGTTRDPVDTVIRYEGRSIRFVDTAGMRRKSRVVQDIEYYSVNRAVKNIRQADMTLLVLDAVEGLTEQEKKIISLVREAHKGLLIVVNKWDLVDKGEVSFSEYVRKLRNEVPWLEHIPVVTISGLTGQRISRLPSLILEIDANCRRKIETAKFNRFLATLKLSERLKIYYGTQVHASPPVFQIFVNDERKLDDGRKEYIMKKICAELGFNGVFPDLQVKTRRGRSER